LAKPTVDGLERDLDGKAAVLRLDVRSPVGRESAARFGVRAVPTLVVVDGQGHVVLTQVGRFHPADIRAKVESLLSTTER
jgi:thioredoxin-related protein